MRERMAAPRSVVVYALMAILAGPVPALVLGGCGTDIGGSPSSSNPLTVQPAATDPTTSSTQYADPSDFQDVFVELAVVAEPMAVMTPTYLPQGTTLAEEWWPVAELTDPASYEGPPAANPRILGSGASSEIQVVFQTGAGWLLIVENLQGDLGDVSATPVGMVEGNPASLYDVNGGRLVQWSVDGLWYGVFGRGVSEDEVIKTALGMRALAPGES